jgi:hypothetical protein
LINWNGCLQSFDLSTKQLITEIDNLGKACAKQ